GCTDSLLQGSFLIVIGLFFNIKYTLYSLIVVILFLLFLSAATTSLGLAIGAQMSSFEGFGLIQSFVIMPLFFLSGALYPLENLPAWLLVVTRVNPLTYIVDGMRGALLGLNHFPIWMDLGVALVFMITMILAGTLSFMRMR
ncbi:MAG: ABC transporter permease, partial [Candidatus Methanomethylicaceae archaeon]